MEVPSSVYLGTGLVSYAGFVSVAGMLISRRWRWLSQADVSVKNEALEAAHTRALADESRQPLPEGHSPRA
jgi:hypothetical protein